MIRRCNALALEYLDRKCDVEACSKLLQRSMYWLHIFGNDVNPSLRTLTFASLHRLHIRWELHT